MRKGKDRIYGIWSNMKYRCHNKNSTIYKRYGGRGIKVCDEWLVFDNFYKWSLENGYSDDFSIDRIDVNGNYEPNNCRWTDWVTQNNNTTSNRIIEYNGESHTMAEWSRILDIGYRTLKSRLRKHDVETSFTMKTPKSKWSSVKEYKAWYYQNVEKEKRKARKKRFEV